MNKQSRVFLDTTVLLVLFLCGGNIGSDTGDFWKSTSTSSVIRGSHFNLQNYGLRRKSDSAFGIDLAVQTTWGLSDKYRISDSFVVDNFAKQLQKVVANILKEENLADLRKVIDGVGFDYVTANLMLRTSQQINDFVVGVDIPLMYKNSHFGVTSKDKQDLKGVVDKFVEIFDGFSGGGSSGGFSGILSKDEVAELDYRLRNNDQKGLGDIRFFCEHNFWDRDDAVTLDLGGEVFVAVTNPRRTVPLTLMSSGNHLTEVGLSKDFLTFFSSGFSLSSSAGIKMKEDVLSILDNFISTLEHGVLNPQHDHLRSGFGAYLKNNYSGIHDYVDLFSRTRIAYLFSNDRVMVIPLEGYDVLSAFGFVTTMKPVVLFQLDLGGSFQRNGYAATLGYDFYFRTGNQIRNVNDPFDAKGENLLSKMLISRAETSKIIQHRLFSNLEIEFELQSGSRFSVGLSGNLTLNSDGFKKIKNPIALTTDIGSIKIKSQVVETTWGIGLHLDYRF